MGRRARHLIFLTFACAFSSCLAEVALRVDLSPETTSLAMATSAQPLYQSSPHQSTTVHFNSTVSLETTPTSHGTTEQTTEQGQVTATPGQHTTAQAGSGAAATVTAPADGTGAAAQATAQAMLTVTAAARNTTMAPVSSTRVSTGMTGPSTSLKHTTVNAQVTVAAISSAATTTQTAKPTTRSGTQTTATRNATATAMTNATTSNPATQTVTPTPAPQASDIPTGTYAVSDGNETCIKAVMGLQLIAQYTQKEQVDYVTVNPNVTQTSGSCGMVQSELNLTFSGGFVNFTFVKQAPSYSVSKIESRMLLPSEGMLYHAAINEKLFTTKLGNSFKCASRQTFTLNKDFQILFVHMQLQAFDIVGNQFGKEEECFPDRNSKAAPVAVGLSILGLFVIVFATFLISRRKPHRGYERI
ncbi:lysosome-associated membrane glycoprotein 3 isoform X2 [Pithys albifrons albifrons]|uniref:lysosome-associated membrane glycoprotein 3 isoform X2 n=1 Tax=Pithys albifrons albifrons TaxID=3385563 RepID=UPI003A5CD260